MSRSFILYVLLLFLLPTNLFSQKNKVKNNAVYDKKVWHWGYTMGVNTMAFRLTPSNNFLKNDSVYGLSTSSNTGFNLGGPIINLRLGEYFDLRTMVVLSFSQRDLLYTLKRVKQIEGKAPFYEHLMRIESIYSEFPLLLKYKGMRLNNIRPYIIGGCNFKIDWATQNKIRDDELPKIRLNPLDFCFEIGFGFDFYLEYFKFSTELKLSMGTKNLVRFDETQYTRSIDQLKSRMIMLSFHFE